MGIGGIQSKFRQSDGLYDNGNSGAVKTINWFNGNIQKVTVSEDCIFSMTNPLGDILRLVVVMGAIRYFCTWPTSIIWPKGKAALSCKRNTVTIIELCYDNPDFFGDYTIY